MAGGHQRLVSVSGRDVSIPLLSSRCTDPRVFRGVRQPRIFSDYGSLPARIASARTAGWLLPPALEMLPKTLCALRGAGAPAVRALRQRAEEPSVTSNAATAAHIE